MNITPEMLASLPPNLRQEMRRRLYVLLAELDVKPKVMPDGQLVVDMAELAPALGMSVEEAAAIAGADGLLGVDPASLAPLQ